MRSGANWTEEEFAQWCAEHGQPVPDFKVKDKPSAAAIITPALKNVVPDFSDLSDLSDLQAKGIEYHEDDEMNDTEARYRDVLELRRIAKEIICYRFEAITLKLARKTSYTPDFFVLMKDLTLQIHEVKTFTRKGKLLITDDGNVKLKVAARLYPFLDFRMQIYEPNTGEFIERRIKAQTKKARS